MATRKIEVQILGDSSKLEKAFGSASKSTSGFGSKIGGGLATLAKGAAFAGAAVGGGLVVALKSGIEQMNQQAAASAQTAAVLKSTAGAANVTQKGVEGLAGALQAQTGIADDSIQSGENMLLTFTNVRNEAGKGNDVFNQATKTMLDMSTAMGTDSSKTAIQLGKALNDPIKGVSALSKVGVTFTAGQKESIKAMVESGNTMGAQKLILGELNKEFGGSAKAFGDTFPGQIEKTKRSFENVTQSLAQALLPALTTVLNFINTTVIPGFQALVDWGQRNWPAFKAAIQAAFDWIRTNVVPIVQAAFTQVKAIIQGVITVVVGLWNRFGSDIVNVARTYFTAIVGVIGPVLNTIKAVIQTVLALIKGDWSGVWDGLKAIVDNALKAVVAIIKGLVTVFAAAMKLLAHAALDAFVAIISGLAGAAKAAVMGGVKAIAGLVGAAAAAAERLGKAVVTGIVAGLVGLARLAGKIVAPVVSAISSVLSTAYGAAKAIGSKIVSGAVDGVAGIGTAIKNKVGGLLSSALSHIDIPGFSPPMHAAAEAIGKPLAQGVAMGFWAGSDAMEKKVKERLALVTAGLAREATSAGERVTAALATGMANAAAINAQAITRNLQPLQDAIAKFDAQVANRTFSRQMEDLTASSLAARDALFAVQSSLGLGTSEQAFTGDTSAFLAEDLAALRAAEQTFQRAEEDRAALSAAQLRTAWQNQLDALPHLAEGGIVRKPTLAVIGENGPEVVSPLGGRGTGGINLTVNNYGNHLDELSMAARLSWQLRTAMG